MPSVFICHASEDKDALVRPLAHALKEQRIDVWYDEFSMKVGDSLRESIDRGLAQSDFGIVVVSPSFFAKRWPQRELNGLVAREMAGEGSVILPVWHDIDRDQILAHSPPLADTVAASSALGLEMVVAKLLAVVRADKSAVTLAREALTAIGVETPSATDDWWLDIAEAKEAQLRFPEDMMRWIFPLPHRHEGGNVARGANLASTVLQLDWSDEAEQRDFCQLTHPDQLHDFLRRMPGLFDTARAHPALLALYAPQLTIPGFDRGLADIFDGLLNDPRSADAFPSYGPPDTTDGKPALCGDLIAWRHPSLGNITSRDLALSFVRAHGWGYTRHHHSTFDCMTWLLSAEADWLPARIRDRLIEGMRSGLWFDDLVGKTRSALMTALLQNTRRGFRLTRTIKADTEELFTGALNRLALDADARMIADIFFERDFVQGYYDQEERLQRMRARRPSAKPDASSEGSGA